MHREGVVTIPAQEVSTIVVGTYLRVKTSVSTKKASETSDASTHGDLVRKETSV